jgi:hypothetical protein
MVLGHSINRPPARRRSVNVPASVRSRANLMSQKVIQTMRRPPLQHSMSMLGPAGCAQNQWRYALHRSRGTSQEIGLRVSSLLALLLLSLCNGGCFSPAALGTVETTGSSAPAVLDHVGRGQGIGFCLANYEDVTAATLRAAAALSLEQKDKNVEKDRASFRFYDANNDRIDIIIVRRSATMTSIEFDVGWFGPVALGRLMSRQIIAELHRSEAFLQDWTTDKANK